METLSYVVLVLLSLVGYSGGASAGAGKRRELKPGIADLILVVFVWAAAVYSRVAFDIDKWLLILVWVGVAAVVGWVSVSFRKLPAKESTDEDETKELSSGIFKRLWSRWTAFSRKMGSFQSRVLLSFFFFIVISPLAFLIAVLGDPLKIKKKKAADSYWAEKMPVSAELEDFRRQF